MEPVVLVIFLMITIVSVIAPAVVLYKILRTVNSWPKAECSWYRYQFAVQLCCLMVADIIGSAGFGVSWHWVAPGMKTMQNFPPVCRTQSSLLVLGVMVHSLFTLFIGITTLVRVVFSRDCPKRVFNGITAGIWIVALALVAVAQHVFSPKDGRNVFQNQGLWVRWIHNVDFRVSIFLTISY
jgi:hypothetical protein